MRILIAGGGGFVGGVLARKLAAHELVIPSREPSRLAAAGIRGDFPLFHEDLQKLASESGAEIVINLLGIIRENDGATFALVHEEYTRRLLAGARACGAKKFIQMSALGAAPGAASAYHRTKFAAEEAVRSSGLPYVIFRPSYISGAGQKLRSEMSALARFVPFFAVPRDVYAAPVSAGVVGDCFVRAAEDDSVKNEIFELAGDKAVPFSRLVASELKAAGIKRPVIGLPRAFFYPLLPLFNLLEPPPMTRDQYLMMAAPNVPSGEFRGAGELLGSKMV